MTALLPPKSLRRAVSTLHPSFRPAMEVAKRPQTRKEGWNACAHVAVIAELLSTFWASSFEATIKEVALILKWEATNSYCGASPHTDINSARQLGVPLFAVQRSFLWSCRGSFRSCRDLVGVQSDKVLAVFISLWQQSRAFSKRRKPRRHKIKPSKCSASDLRRGVAANFLQPFPLNPKHWRARSPQNSHCAKQGLHAHMLPSLTARQCVAALKTAPHDTPANHAAHLDERLGQRLS